MQLELRLCPDVSRVAISIEAHSPPKATEDAIGGELSPENLQLTNCAEAHERQAHLRGTCIGREQLCGHISEAQEEPAAQPSECICRGCEPKLLLRKGKVHWWSTRLEDLRGNGREPVHSIVVEANERHAAQIERRAHQLPIVELHIEGDSDGTGGAGVPSPACSHPHPRDDREGLERTLDKARSQVCICTTSQGRKLLDVEQTSGGCLAVELEQQVAS